MFYGGETFAVPLGGRIVVYNELESPAVCQMMDAYGNTKQWGDDARLAR